MRNDMKPITITFSIKERELYEYIRQFNSPSSHIKDLIKNDKDGLVDTNHVNKIKSNPKPIGLFD